MDSQRPLTYAEHKEFCERMVVENKRLADEDKRQNRRLDALEETVRQIGTLATSVEKLAVNMESMLREQEQQGKRLETLESQNGEMEIMRDVNALSTAIEKLTVSMANAAREQEQQNERLSTLEGRGGDETVGLSSKMCKFFIGGC